MSLLGPEAKEGRAPLGLLWKGWLQDFSDWMRASKEGESSGWVFEVEVLEECGGLIMGSQVLQNQPGSESAWDFDICMQERWKNRLHFEHWVVNFPTWVCLAMAMVTSTCSLWAWLLSVSGRALATVERGSYWHYNLVACRYASAAIWEPLLTGAAFNFCFSLGSLTMVAFFTSPRHCRELSQLFILFLNIWIHLGIVLSTWVYFQRSWVDFIWW